MPTQAEKSRDVLHSSVIGGYAEWHKARCTECKKTYSRTDKWVYGNCCSYSCYRVKGQIREKRAREKRQIMMEQARNPAIATDQERAAKRVKKCEEKLEKYQRMHEESPIGDARRHRARGLVTVWSKKLNEAKEAQRKIAQICR